MKVDMKIPLLNEDELKSLTGTAPITSRQKLERIINRPEYREKNGIVSFSTLEEGIPYYYSGSTRMGSISGSPIVALNSEAGIQLFDVVPIYCFPDGGLTFLHGISSMYKRLYNIVLISPCTIPIIYNMEIKEKDILDKLLKLEASGVRY